MTVKPLKQRDKMPLHNIAGSSNMEDNCSGQIVKLEEGASAAARAHNGSLGAPPPARSRGRFFPYIYI